MSQTHSNEDRRVEEQNPAAAGQTSVSLGDAPDRDTEADLRREVQALRRDLQTAATAYGNLFREVEQLKKTKTTERTSGEENSQPRTFNSSTLRLAPLSKINGKRAEHLKTWFDMLPTYLQASGTNPESREAVLFIASHFDFPLSKWFIGQKTKNGGDEAGGFSSTSSLRQACLGFHIERTPKKLPGTS